LQIAEAAGVSHMAVSNYKDALVKDFTIGKLDNPI